MAAADALSGRNVWLGIGKQAAVNVPAAPRKFFEVTDISGLLPEYDWKKSDRRVGTRFKPLGYKSGKKVPVSFTVEVNAENIGFLLMLGLGADLLTAAGAAYKHTISLTENLPYFTVWASTDLVADNDEADTVHQVQNCKIVSLKLDGTVDDVLKCSIEAVGTDRSFAYISKIGIACTNTSGQPLLTGIATTTGLAAGMSVSGAGIPANTSILEVTSPTSITLSANTTAAVSTFAAAVPSPTFPGSRSLYVKAEEGQAKVELGSSIGTLAQYDEGVEFHFALSNGVTPDRRIDNTVAAAGLREGDSEITGSLKVSYNRNSFVEIKAFQAGTQRALRFTATSQELAAAGQPYRLTFTADKARYSGTPPAWDPDMITADSQYEVEKTASYPIFEVVNTDAAAY